MSTNSLAFSTQLSGWVGGGDGDDAMGWGGRYRPRRRGEVRRRTGLCVYVCVCVNELISSLRIRIVQQCLVNGIKPKYVFNT